MLPWYAKPRRFRARKLQPAALGHYLKLILDWVLGPTIFKNEIVWKRSSAHSDTAKKGGREKKGALRRGENISSIDVENGAFQS